LTNGLGFYVEQAGVIANLLATDRFHPSACCL
jgi:hypothetical protein